ncbi:leucine-rich repeat-containing protein 15-like [Schistocerca gregaria]|uniref:leucine-rich repeat-containing protein 15-like n=1 Tax=Schistocerca gregaria TaxID=7010 RepID=UPI00211DD9BB|nr:leucine-rich repeat-containing protein 15-like [Schistocerca gregaria]
MRLVAARVAAAAALLVVAAAVGVAQAEEMCSVCACASSGAAPALNCSSRGLQRHFANDSESEEAGWLWADDMLGVVSVDFSHNDLVRVHKFPMLPALRVLDLSHNRIEEIDPAAFEQLQNLTELDLSNNELVTAALKPIVFQGLYAMPEYMPLKSLRRLSLANNVLHALDSDVFDHIEKLEVLDLRGNKFSIISQVTADAIGSLFHLKSLDLSFCDIEALPETFLHPPKDLQQLWLAGNRFTKLPDELKNSHNLSLLDLSQNPIPEISKAQPFPASLESLTTLVMTYMPLLRAVDGSAMANLTGLRELQLHHNPRLSELRGELPYSLRKIWLNDNNLSRLDGAQELGRSNMLKLVDIRYNPWVCDCDTQWMVSVLTPLINRTTPELLTGAGCEHPEEMRGKTFAWMWRSGYNMRCLPTDGSKPERDAAMLVGVLLGLLLGMALLGVAIFLHRRRLLPACLTCETGPAAFSRGFYKRAGPATDEMY